MGLSKGLFLILTIIKLLTKMNKENIGLLIDQKKERLPRGVNVFGPEDKLPIQTQADWLTSLLCQVYVQHGITRNREKLVADIEPGCVRFGLGSKKESQSVVPQ